MQKKTPENPTKLIMIVTSLFFLSRDIASSHCVLQNITIILLFPVTLPPKTLSHLIIPAVEQEVRG